MHVHINNKSTIGRNLTISIFLNFIIASGEITAGILSNSLALVSDALHNFGDLLSLILSLFASKISLWKATPNKTYGYLRAEIIVAFINSSALVIIGIYIIYEAGGRFFNPEPIAGIWIIVVAVISLFGNLISTYLLHKNSKEDLNAKTAYLHLLYDSINSLLVIVAGIFIYFMKWYFLDPLFSVIIGMFIIKSGWDVIIETVNILIEGTPKQIDLNKVSSFFVSYPEVKNIHHLHIWSISSKMTALSVHVVVDDQLISKGYLIIDRLEKGLYDKFGIDHPTIQLEADIGNENYKILNLNH